MTEAEFLEFTRSAALRATSNIGRIGHLVCTQANAKGEPTLREPEIRSAFQQEAEERGLYYGIEVPTNYTYRFTNKEGEKRRRALVDFALHGSDLERVNWDVLLEFKQGQPSVVRSGENAAPDYPTIRKDLHKLWGEPANYGRCMFHICRAADAGTLTAIKAKYNAVTHNSMNLASATMRAHSGPAAQGDNGHDRWFLLLILVLRQRDEQSGSFLHRATWDGSQWVFIKPEPLSPATAASTQP